MKIIIFGSTGMLGNYVQKYISQFFTTECICRSYFDIESCDWINLRDILKSSACADDVIINCAGAIPQQKCDVRKYITLNTLFPHKLNEISREFGLKFIHITTDCVFSGKSENYDETSVHDAEDVYGITKSLGEDTSMCIIRTSIIGEERKNKNSLLEWVIRQKNGTIDGYNHVFWNGVTCLQLAKIIKDVIQNNAYWEGVRHIFSPNTVSKYELCMLINEIYDLGIHIDKKDLPYKNMTLSSVYDGQVNYIIPDIQMQIKEQCGYLDK
jgi:dTDP-4-dehydrorhamnose reductase